MLKHELVVLLEKESKGDPKASLQPNKMTIKAEVESKNLFSRAKCLLDFCKTTFENKGGNSYRPQRAFSLISGLASLMDIINMD